MFLRRTVTLAALFILAGTAFAAEKAATPCAKPEPSTAAAPAPVKSLELLVYVLGPSFDGSKQIPTALEPVVAQISNDFGATNLAALGQGMALTSSVGRASSSLSGRIAITKDTTGDYQFSAENQVAERAGSTPEGSIAFERISFELNEMSATPVAAPQPPAKRSKKDAAPPPPPSPVVMRPGMRNSPPACGMTDVCVPLGKPVLVGRFTTDKSLTPVYVVILVRPADKGK